MEQLETTEIQKKIYTSWLVKCTQEQKEHLQKECAQSGKAVPEFLLETIKQANLKEVFADHEETQKEFTEMNRLIDRLQQMLFAKMAVVIEKERDTQELKRSLSEKEQACQQEAENLKEELQEKFEEKCRLFKKGCELSFQKEKQLLLDDNNQIKAQLIQVLDTNESLESRLKKAEQDKENLQSQLSQAHKNYEIADDRLKEVQLKLKEFEEKSRLYEREKSKNDNIEKELTVLRMTLENSRKEEALKYESLAKQEAMKREYLEKDLRREFELHSLKALQSNSKDSSVNRFLEQS